MSVGLRLQPLRLLLHRASAIGGPETAEFVYERGVSAAFLWVGPPVFNLNHKRLTSSYMCVLPSADGQATVEGKATASTEPDKRLAFFGVYDGHGGDKVAIYTGYSCKVSDPVDRLLREPADASGLHGPCSFMTEDPRH
jgi:hypothetical protein